MPPVKIIVDNVSEIELFGLKEAVQMVANDLGDISFIVIELAIQQLNNT